MPISTRAPLGPLLDRGYRRSVEALPMPLRRRVRYFKRYGRLPNLNEPVRFSEKVTWRILNDRRPELNDTCDKARMKRHAERTAPPWVRVPQSVWQGTDVGELSMVDLPAHWVLKPNHRTGLVLFGSGRADVADLRRRTAGWLESHEWTKGGEWAYSAADRSFIVEERIGPPGVDLTDYKFYVFHGKVRLAQSDTNRFTEHGCRLYTPDWRFRGSTRRFPAGREVPRPALLPQMIQAAEAIGAGFDFMRVDLYEYDGELWFGEITPYPGSGLVELDSDLDLEMGSWWTLPQLT